MTMIERLPGITYATLPHGYGPALRPWPPRLVVVHKTANASASAQDEAHYATTRRDGDPTSAHFYVDHGSVLGSVPLTMQAWAARQHGNAIGWHVEICGRSSPADWDLTEVRRAAQLVRWLVDLARLPVGHLTPAQIRAGGHGLAGHHDVVLAYPEDHGTHHDPDWTPGEWLTFVQYVKSASYRYAIVTAYGTEPRWSTTLAGIADHTQTTVARLLALNPWIQDPDVVHPGDRIRYV